MIAPYDRLATGVAERFGGLSDSIELGLPAGVPPELLRELLTDLRAIPTRFTGSPTTW